MASHRARPQLGLFGNPVRVWRLDELAETARELERERPGRTVEELSGSLQFAVPVPQTRQLGRRVGLASGRLATCQKNQ